jgi:hypothetical protein
MTHLASALLSAALLWLPDCGGSEMPRRVEDHAEATPAPPASFADATVKQAVRARAELDQTGSVQSVSCGMGPRFVCNVDFGGTCATYHARVRRDGTVLVTPPPGPSLCVSVAGESGTSEAP